MKKHIAKKEIQIKDWDNIKHLKGFYMTNVRGSRDKFINGDVTQNPIWFRKDMMNELAEGINEKSKTRINVFYEDGETNPNNYKFMVRELLSSTNAEVSNTSMYNI